MQENEFAPYCGDTIGMSGAIRQPVEYGGTFWISTGTGIVYRVVPHNSYRSPHPDLPLPMRDHVALPDEHPFRYSYEGVIVTWQRQKYVLTDEHSVPAQPWIPDPRCLNGTCAACSIRGPEYEAATPEERLANRCYHNCLDPGFDPHAVPPTRSSRSPCTDRVIVEELRQLNLFSSDPSATLPSNYEATD